MSTSPFGQQPSDGSTIEFPCQQCGQKLKVPISAVGRFAKCPQCSSTQPVPDPASGAAPNLLLDSPPVNTPAGGTLLGNTPVGSTPPLSMPPAAQPQPLTPLSNPIPASGPSLHELAEAKESKRTVASATNRTVETHVGEETATRQLFESITSEISKIFVGQDELVLGTLVALFSSGHVLIESVPGLGKTLFVRTLGRVLGCEFGRIQFTADLMPSDITGAPIFDMKTQEFRFHPGPVFTQLLLADEINRAPAKTHAALLEIMQEFRVTIDGTSHTIERPFLTLATQNPIESEGTYNLPEAQLDRFMFKLIAEYPGEGDEREILKLHSRQVDISDRLESEIATVCTPQEILRITRENSDIRIDDKLFDYVNKIVRLTRQWPQFHMGASPRAGLALVQAARTLAAFRGRDYAVPDDVAEIILPALRHRVALTAEAEVEGHNIDELLTDLVRTVEVPRI